MYGLRTGRCEFSQIVGGRMRGFYAVIVVCSLVGIAAVGWAALGMQTAP